MTLVNLCCCLIVVDLLYATGINRVGNNTLCDAITFLLHFATGACTGYMVANSYQILRAFTSVSFDMTLCSEMNFMLQLYRSTVKLKAGYKTS